MRKLSIGATFGQAYSLTFGNLGLFARVAAVPFGLILAMNLALILFANPPKDWMVIAQNILTIIIQVPIFTSWHRFTLLPRSQAVPTMGFTFTLREVRFFGYLLAMSLSIATPSLLLIAAGQQGNRLVALLLLVVVLLVWARLILVFPAAAVGDRVHLRDSWRLTQGNGWRIFWLQILVSLPLGAVMLILLMIFASIVVATRDPTFVNYSSIPMVFVFVILVGINASTQAIVYRDLADYDPATFTPA